MLKIKIILAGRIRERYFRDAANEYLKRLGPYAKVKLIEVQDEPLPVRESEKSLAAIRDIEKERILKVLEPHDYVVAMDLGGREFSSEAFSRWMEDRADEGIKGMAFVIGGTTGLSGDILNKADAKLSLGAMTFPHQMVPMLLLEQIYRGMKIQKGEPYHR